MTYQSRATRATNRVMMALVLITVLIVAFWAVNGGLDDIVVTETNQVNVTE
ncbi:MAG: hypothetical protein PVF87_08965 [Acidimicrobiia bacterium]